MKRYKLYADIGDPWPMEENKCGDITTYSDALSALKSLRERAAKVCNLAAQMCRDEIVKKMLFTLEGTIKNLPLESGEAPTGETKSDSLSSPPR